MSAPVYDLNGHGDRTSVEASELATCCKYSAVLSDGL
jgi:hypothetical protein